MKKQKLSISVPKDLAQQVRDQAEKENRNFSNMVSVLIEKGLSKREKEKAA